MLRGLPKRMLLTGCAAALIAAGGCGEATYDAAEFVEDANAEGAGLKLGEPVSIHREEVQVFDVSVEGGEGGSLAVASDATGGEAEYARCEGAVTLLCYRAANIVLLVEDELDPAARARLDAAFTALGTE